MNPATQHCSVPPPGPGSGSGSVTRTWRVFSWEDVLYLVWGQRLNWHRHKTRTNRGTCSATTQREDGQRLMDSSVTSYRTSCLPVKDQYDQNQNVSLWDKDISSSCRLTPFLEKTLFIHLVKVFFWTAILCSCSSLTRPAPSSSPSILIGWKSTHVSNKVKSDQCHQWEVKVGAEMWSGHKTQICPSSSDVGGDLSSDSGAEGITRSPRFIHQSY